MQLFDKFGNIAHLSFGAVGGYSNLIVGCNWIQSWFLLSNVCFSTWKLLGQCKQFANLNQLRTEVWKQATICYSYLPPYNFLFSWIMAYKVITDYMHWRLSQISFHVTISQCNDEAMFTCYPPAQAALEDYIDKNRELSPSSPLILAYL